MKSVGGFFLNRAMGISSLCGDRPHDIPHSNYTQPTEPIFKHPEEGFDFAPPTPDAIRLGASMDMHLPDSPPPEPMEDVKSELYWERRAKDLTSEVETLNANLRTAEQQLIEAKENCVLNRPINHEECQAQAEIYSKEIFDIHNAGRHVTAATDIFDLEEMLQKVRIIREEFPATVDLKQTYDKLERDLQDANGRRLEKKQELTHELNLFLSLKRDVLKLEPVEQIASDVNAKGFDITEETSATLRPEFFEQSRLWESRTLKRIKALQRALADNSKLEETASQLSTNTALGDLEKYFQAANELLLKDAATLKDRRQDFKAARASTQRELEETKLKLRYEKKDLEESIRTKKAQIEHDLTKLLSVNVAIREKENDEDKMHKVDHKLEEMLAEAQRTLNGRIDDTRIGATMSRVQQGIGESIKEDCAKRLNERRNALENLLIEAQWEFYSICKAHWKNCVIKYNNTAEQVKEADKEYRDENMKLRRMKKQSAEDKFTDYKTIIRLKEATCETLKSAAKVKKDDLEGWQQELSIIDRSINENGIIKALQGSHYQSHVQEDFRQAFNDDKKLREQVEWLETIKDYFATLCDMKEGAVNAAKDELNAEILDQLLDALDSLDNKGGAAIMMQVLQNRTELLNTLRLMHSIMNDVVNTRAANQPATHAYGRSLPLRAALTKLNALVNPQEEEEGEGRPARPARAHVGKTPANQTNASMPAQLAH